MMKDTATVLPRHDPTKESRVILELPIPKPGGHVLSPEFDRVKRWAAIKMDLRKYTWKNYVNRPVMLSLG